MIIIILLLAFFLRMIGIDQSFWLDEAITATIARDLSLAEILRDYLPLDNSPPLYVLIINLLFAILPNTEFVDRIFSVLVGVLTVLFVYKIGEITNGKKYALFAALLLATSPLHVYYSQEGRMYALTAFLATVLIWSIMNISKKSRIKFYIFYIVSATLLFYTHYVSGLMLLVANLVMLFLKKWDKKWFFAQIAVFLLYIPWLSVFLKQLKLGVEGRGVSEIFDKVLGKFDPKMILLTVEKFTLGRVPVDMEWYLPFVLLAVLTFSGVLILGFLKAGTDNRKIFGTWLFIPIFLTALISTKIPVFLYYRVLYALPAFYLLIAFYLTSVTGRLKWAIIFLLLLINFTALIAYYTNPNMRREQWREAISWINSQIDISTLVMFPNGDPVAPYLWYQKGHNQTIGAFSGFYVQDSDEERVSNLVKSKYKLLVFEYLQDITDPQRNLQKWIQKNGFQKISENAFIGVGEIETYVR